MTKDESAEQKTSPKALAGRPLSSQRATHNCEDDDVERLGKAADDALVGSHHVLGHPHVQDVPPDAGGSPGGGGNAEAVEHRLDVRVQRGVAIGQ